MTMVIHRHTIHRLGLLSLVLVGIAPVAGEVTRLAFREKQSWTVLIALTKYQDQGWSARRQAVETAASLADVLRERYAYKGANIWTLYNDQAEKRQILDVLAQVGAKGSPNDTVFLYVDTQITSDRPAEPIPGPEASTLLVPFDGKKDDPKTLIRSDELCYLVERYLPTQSVFVVINGYVKPSGHRTPRTAQQAVSYYPKRLFQVLSLSDPRGEDLGPEFVRILKDAQGPVSARDIYQALSRGQPSRVQLESMTDAPTHFIFEFQNTSPGRERISALVRKDRPAQERIEQITALRSSIPTSTLDNSKVLADSLFRVLLEIAQDETDALDVRRQAVWGIGQLKNPDGARALRDLYRKTRDDSLHLTILDVLVGLDRGEALPLLRSGILDENRAVAACALRGLARLEDKESLGDVQRLLGQTDDPEILVTALHALPALQPSREAVQPALRHLLTHGESSVRAQTVRTLTRIGGDSLSLDALIHLLLEDDAADVRQATAYALAELNTPEKTDAIAAALLQALQDSVASVRHAAAFSLGQIHATGAVDQLLARAVHEEEEETVRVAAIGALGEIGITGTAEEKCVQLVRLEKRSAIRLAAVVALSKSPDPQTTTVFLQALGDSDFYVAQAAGEALQQAGAKNPGAFVDLLKRSGFRDLEPEARIQVIQGLPLVEDANVVRMLIEELGSTSAAVREAALASLRNFQAGPSFTLIVASLDSPSPLVRSGIATLLGSTPQARFLPLLIERLAQEQDDGVRAEVIRSLASYDDTRAREAVDRVAEKESNRAVLLGMAAFYDAEADRQAARREFGNAASYADRALSLRRRLDPVEEAEGLNKMGELLARQEKLTEALDLHMKALALQSRELPSGDMRSARTRRRIAQVLAQQKSFRRAESFLLEALNIGQNVLGLDHQEVSSMYAQLAGLYEAMGEPQRSQLAQRQYREASSRRYGDKLFEWRFKGWISFETLDRVHPLIGKWITALDGKIKLKADEHKLVELLPAYLDTDTLSERIRAAEFERVVANELDLPISREIKGRKAR